MNIYEDLRNYFLKLIEEKEITGEEVEVSYRVLEGEEVLGKTNRKDYPLLVGKEKMLEARFRDSIGQAFTQSGSLFYGNLRDVLELDLKNDYDRGIFIASLNAVMRYYNIIDRTVHCKWNEPEECAKEMAQDLQRFKEKNLVLVGFQPAFIEALVKEGYTLRVLDLNPENIGTDNLGALIEDGKKDYQKVIDWADLILCTGSTVVNGSITDYLNLDKEVYFYGNSIAGAAKILGLNRICKKAS